MKRILTFLILVIVALPLPVMARTTSPQTACGDAATLIHEIQGTADTSTITGQTVIIEGIVTGEFLRGLDGFFMQEELDQQDADPATSEGIFVYGDKVDVMPGDVVRVEGKVFEYSAGSDGTYLTEIRRPTSVTVCSTGVSASPVELDLPVANLEAYEGMLVTIPEALTLNDLYNLGRYSEIVLSPDGRLVQPTQVVTPGPDAVAMQAEIDQRRLVLDDGSSTENPDFIPYPSGGLSANNTVRAGDTITGLTGVIDHAYSDYLIYPTEPFDFTVTNPRPAAPDEVGGSVRVASLNLLNYFNGAKFPTPRGASNPDEFTRQRDKTINVILALNADVIAVMEMENDGSGPDSAMADLVNGLNAIAGEGTYAYISDPEDYPLPDEGGDDIKNAILYRPAAVIPVEASLADYDPIHNRPPVAQTFDVVATGKRFSVIAVHFKSKGCTDARGDDGDQDDGQSCYNGTRTRQAEALLAFVEVVQSQSWDNDVLLMGDFNSYAMEDPIQTMLAAGFIDTAAQFVPGDYSYVYMGQMGTLDYILASPSLMPQLTGATHWHINADEARVLDYNMEYKSDEQVEAYYDPAPYRAADHDPVLIGLELGE